MFDAAILVDMQKDFVCDLRRGDLERIVPNQLYVIKRCNEMKIPIIVLEYFDFGKTIRRLRRKIVKNKKHTFILKYHDSGFINTELNETLVSLNAKCIFIMGINAAFCVKDTARDAVNYGYEIITSADVISGMPDHPRDDNIRWYRRNGTVLKRIQEIL